MRTELEVFRQGATWYGRIARTTNDMKRTTTVVLEDERWRVLTMRGERSQPLPESEAVATLDLLVAEAEERGEDRRSCAYTDEVREHRLACRDCGLRVGTGDELREHCALHGHKMGGADACACGERERPSRPEPLSKGVRDAEAEPCRHCGDPIVYADYGAWVDENGLRSCAPHALRHQPERTG